MRSKLIALLSEVALIGFLAFLTTKAYIDASRLVTEARGLSIENLVKLVKSALYMLIFIVMALCTSVVFIVIAFKNALFD